MGDFLLAIGFSGVLFLIKYIFPLWVINAFTGKRFRDSWVEIKDELILFPTDIQVLGLSWITPKVVHNTEKLKQLIHNNSSGIDKLIDTITFSWIWIVFQVVALYIIVLITRKAKADNKIRKPFLIGAYLWTCIALFSSFIIG